MSVDRLLPEGLLDIMQCIRCGGELREDVAAGQLECAACGVRYPVEDGTPVMLDEEAIEPA
jgi:uncharacterized protein YbaR (Trm112 family)